MTDLDKLNAIITKAQWIRKSTGVTPREFMLADLVEALAIELKNHDAFDGHTRVIGGALGGPPPGEFDTEITPQEVEEMHTRFGFPRRRLHQSEESA